MQQSMPVGRQMAGRAGDAVWIGMSLSTRDDGGGVLHGTVNYPPAWTRCLASLSVMPISKRSAGAKPGS